ncbi:GMC family oxidoreductase [Variovorax sp. GB1P17]|uniref:GMC family oxidoreductase n=1 Tax=Variovorax sp. GB1P17 TaxID=3443740 RepID=UPI003F455D9C
MSAPDVIVVGSGAAGGMAVYELCRVGLKVLLIEAGRDYSPGTETPMFQTPAEAPLRGTITPDKPSGFYNATVAGGWSVPGEPYEVASGAFTWWRPRMLGGRTNHWGRVALRFGPYDFKPHSRDGLGVDWPLAYSDVDPWYEKVERLIGVTGTPHGYENAPDSAPGVLLPPPQPRAHEIVLASAFRKLGMPIADIHAAILTRPLNGRAPCCYATQCTRGCSSKSNFQSTTVLIPAALATGNLSIVTNALVQRIEMLDGRAHGVTYVDRNTGLFHTIGGRAIVLGAGSFSTVRILFNSRGPGYESGLGNKQGQLGKFIMDSVEYTMQAHVPLLERVPPQNDDGIFTPHIYVPWWLYAQQQDGTLDFPRGYHIEPRGGRRMPSISVGGYVDAASPLFGAHLRDEIRRKYGSYVFLTGEGEMIPNDATYCELHPSKTDQWGVPILSFRWEWGQNEVRQADHMRSTFSNVFRLLGGRTISEPPGMPTGGGAIHEVGGARMGTHPTNSVTDVFGKCWEAENVFLADGSVFASSPDKNPTLTILALSARCAQHIIDRAASGSL